MEDYEYLNKSRREVDGVDDKEEWNILKVIHAALYNALRLTFHVRLLLIQLASTPQNNSISSAL